jgi:hypothetical protein
MAGPAGRLWDNLEQLERSQTAATVDVVVEHAEEKNNTEKEVMKAYLIQLVKGM